MGSTLLKNPKVAAIVRSADIEAEADLDRKAAMLGITKAKMLKRLRAEAFSVFTDFVTIVPAKGREGDDDFTPQQVLITPQDKWTPSMKRAVKKLKFGKNGELELELHSPKDAREQICKILGWNREQLEISGSIDNDVQVHVNLPDNGRGDNPQPVEKKPDEDGSQSTPTG